MQIVLAFSNILSVAFFYFCCLHVCSFLLLFLVQVWLRQKYYTYQVRPDRGSNSWPPDHHVQFISCHWDVCSNHLAFSDLFLAEVLRIPSFTCLAFELMTSRSWQYISHHWDSCCNNSVISDPWYPAILLWPWRRQMPLGELNTVLIQHGASFKGESCWPWTMLTFV